MQLERSLKNFYRAYAAWLEAGAPEKNENPYRFDRGFGLCSNVTIFFTENVNGEDVYDVTEGYNALRQMKDQFVFAGLDSNTPFNKPAWGYGENYFSESFDRRCYLNESRIEWVKSHAEDE